MLGGIEASSTLVLYGKPIDKKKQKHKKMVDKVPTAEEREAKVRVRLYRRQGARRRYRSICSKKLMFFPGTIVFGLQVMRGWYTTVPSNRFLTCILDATVYVLFCALSVLPTGRFFACLFDHGAIDKFQGK